MDTNGSTPMTTSKTSRLSFNWRAALVSIRDRIIGARNIRVHSWTSFVFIRAQFISVYSCLIIGVHSCLSAAPPRETASRNSHNNSSSPELAIDLKASDVDLAACKAWVDGKEAQGDFGSGVLATLGVAKGTPWVAIHYTKHNLTDRIQYMIVLKRPVKFQSLLFQRSGSLKYLKAGAKLPTDPSAAEDWIDVVFPPKQSG